MQYDVEKSHVGQGMSGGGKKRKDLRRRYRK